MARFERLVKWLKAFLIVLGAGSAYLAYSILTAPADGTGVSVRILGVALTDRLPGEKVPQAAAVFFVVGLWALLMLLGLQWAPNRRRKSE